MFLATIARRRDRLVQFLREWMNFITCPVHWLILSIVDVHAFTAMSSSHFNLKHVQAIPIN